MIKDFILEGGGVKVDPVHIDRADLFF
ncbi:hypothetical protein PBAL39_07770 [Pedobacter sp. BAL39]|nr:hypothetical protein PBAL39_07770 [Pedobacter sp. BAL39]